MAVPGAPSLLSKLLRRLLAGLAAVWLWTAAPGAGHAQDAAPALDPRKALTQYHLDVWTTADGLPQNSVNAVAQTPDGYLWLGTQEGLARFDGLQFRVYDKASSDLRSNNVSALVAGRDGALWIGTRSGGLARLKDGRLTAFTDAGGPAPRISALAEGPDGALWVGTFDGGLLRFVPDATGGHFTTFNTARGLRSDNVSALVAGRDGALWIGTRDAGLMHLQDGRLTSLTTADGLPAAGVTALLEDRAGALWIGTDRGGLVRYRNRRFTTFSTADGLPADGVTALLEDAAGTLWVGTERGGLGRLRPGAARFETLATADGLAHGWVKALWADHEGSLWIGTESSGLNRLKDGKFTTFTTREGLVHDNVQTVFEAADGSLWVGTEGGLGRYEPPFARAPGRFTAYTTADGLSSDLVFSVYGTRDGAIWAGTYGHGLNRFEPGPGKGGRFTTFTTADGLPGDGVFALYEDTAGDLWIGTDAGLGRYEPAPAKAGGRFTTFTTADGLASDLISTFTESRAGGLWVGTYDGGLDLLRHDASGGRVVAHYDTDDGLLSNYVTSLYEDEAGTLWISTREGGLHRLKDGRLTAYTTADGLFNDNIAQIVGDGRGDLWMSSNKGLFRLSQEALDAFAEGRAASIAPVVYGLRDGLRSQEFNGGVQPGAWRSRDGRLWFTSSAGLVVVDPARLPINRHAPPVFVEAVHVDGAPVAFDGEVSLPPGRSRFAFRYVGLSLLVPEDVRYRYRLHGADATWVDAGTRREAFYTNLAPGAYTFEVVAVNHDGVPSAAPAVVSFYLRPAFYQTVWFYLLCAVGLAAATFGGHRYRVRRLEARQRHLEGLVDERTHRLRQEMEKTETARRVIEEQAEQLREMDQLKTRFFNNISHEFRTPLTLNIGPLENALTGVYGPLPDAMRRQVEVMLRNARRLLRLLNQLLDIAKIESGRMQLKVRRADLVQLVEGVVLSFTAFVEQEGVALDFKTEHAQYTLAFDPEGLEKVFFNLLSNAIKFTPPGGRIDVSLAERVVEVDGAPRTRVEVRVADTGPGIPAEALPKLFDRFQQVDGVVSRVQEGTGIGLALVKELVELHGGTVAVESEVGAGTAFVVTLPADLAQVEDLLGTGPAAPAADVSQGPMIEMAVFDEVAPPAPDVPAGDGSAVPLPAPVANAAPVDAAVPVDAPAPAGEAAGLRPTILVTDDNADIRDYVAGCLAGAYTVATACDGREALERARTLRPDLVISDVMMPGMTGYELCRALKATPGLDHIPVILLTSRATVDDKIEGLASGADDYLTKPFNARELLIRVGNLLTLRLQQRDLVRLNEELRTANDTLRELTELKSQMLRIAAHDLKSPLNAVREFSRIIREDLGAEAPAGELLDVIHASAERMLHMVAQLLDSEALESGELELNRVPIGLPDLARTVVRDLRQQAELKGQRLYCTADDCDTCRVEADVAWLREAVENLVTNAIKYSPHGKAIEVSVRAEGDRVLLAVRDEGPGLTEADKKKLFTKFQRLSARPTGGESSTGLGLSIVHQIVDLHAGRVYAEGAPGAGSTFTIELPAVSSQLSPPLLEADSR